MGLVILVKIQPACIDCRSDKGEGNGIALTIIIQTLSKAVTENIISA